MLRYKANPTENPREKQTTRTQRRHEASYQEECREATEQLKRYNGAVMFFPHFSKKPSVPPLSLSPGFFREP